MYRSGFILILSFFIISFVFAQEEYPYPVNYFNFTLEQKNIKMAYMDVPAKNREAGAVLLLHGKNFSGYYWKDVIPFLRDKGYRVIIPDQIGFGLSDKPDIHYSFHQLASNTKALLDSLGINKISVIGHSMGGMLAVRFSLMYPATVSKLILENPIGLEDYRSFVPYSNIDSLYKQEVSATYESYKKYQQTYYPVWKPEYEELVRQQAVVLMKQDFKDIARVNALTYLMIYEQPVVHEFKDLKAPTMLMIGKEDRTIVGKTLLPKTLHEVYGQYPDLGKRTRKSIRGSILIELNEVGHIPHIQDPGIFKNHIYDFLK